LLLAAPALACADDINRDESDATTHDGNIMQLAQVLARVRPITGENVLTIEVDNATAGLAYSVFFLDPQGRRREIYVDAQTGDILLHKLDE